MQIPPVRTISSLDKTVQRLHHLCEPPSDASKKRPVSCREVLAYFPVAVYLSRVSEVR
jgi:hypothetical protein